MPTTPYAYTSNLQIGLFHDGDRPGENELNSMRNKIDRLVIVRGTLASRPAHAVTTPPRLYYATDDGDGKLYYDDPSLGWTVLLENFDTSAFTAGMTYKGAWDASGGAYPSTASVGDFYKISVAGTIDGTDYGVNDHMIYNGTGWDRIPNAEVTSPADALTQDEVNRLQKQDGDTHDYQDIPMFDSVGDLTSSGYTKSDLDNMQTAVASPTDGNLLQMDGNGDMEDSGLNVSDVTTAQQDIETAEADIDALEARMATAESDIDALEAEVDAIDVDGKMDKISPPTDGNLVQMDENGNAEDSGKSIAAQVNNTDNEVPTGAAVQTYAPARATTPSEDNLKSFDADGNDRDSGVAPETVLTDDSDANVPTSKAVADYAMKRTAYSTDGNVVQFDENGDAEESSLPVADIARRVGTPTENNIMTQDADGDPKDSGKAFETSVTDDDTMVPTSGAVSDFAVPKAISGLSEKTTLHNDDLFVIADSEASNALKKVKKSNVGGGSSTLVIPVTLDCVAYVKAGITGFLARFTKSLIGVYAYSDDAPDGASLKFDVLKNGTSMLSTLCEIDEDAHADDGNVAIKSDGTEDVTNGDRVTISLTQVGSSVPGGNFLYIALVFG